MRAIPGLFVLGLGASVLLLRQVFARSSGIARASILGRDSTRSESSGDFVLVVVLAVGLLVLGFWLAVWALLFC